MNKVSKRYNFTVDEFCSDLHHYFGYIFKIKLLDNLQSEFDDNDWELFSLNIFDYTFSIERNFFGELDIYIHKDNLSGSNLKIVIKNLDKFNDLAGHKIIGYDDFIEILKVENKNSTRENHAI